MFNLKRSAASLVSCFHSLNALLKCSPNQLIYLLYTTCLCLYVCNAGQFQQSFTRKIANLNANSTYNREVFNRNPLNPSMTCSNALQISSFINYVLHTYACIYAMVSNFYKVRENRLLKIRSAV